MKKKARNFEFVVITIDGIPHDFRTYSTAEYFMKLKGEEAVTLMRWVR